VSIETEAPTRARRTVSERIQRFGHDAGEVELARKAAERVLALMAIGPQTGGRDQRFPPPSADQVVEEAGLSEERARLVLALALEMARSGEK
jgi:hypothetical protein